MSETRARLEERAALAIARAVNDREPDDGAYDLAQAVLAAVANDLRAEGAAEVWSRYARQYEQSEKMPRWDQDKAVLANGWVSGRCGNCGEDIGTARVLDAVAVAEAWAMVERLAPERGLYGFDEQAEPGLICVFCSGAVDLEDVAAHTPDCAWVAARAFLETSPLGGPQSRPGALPEEDE